MTAGDEQAAAVTVLRRGVRTYKARRSRTSPRARAALESNSPLLLHPTGAVLDPAGVWGGSVPVVMEIGFGTGGATVEMATHDPGTGVLAIDVHTPGVGELLWRLDRAGLTNVRVMEADALAVLQHRIPRAGLAGVRTFFPDPWPKPRHHKRRIVQPRVSALIAGRLQPEGFWHLATDWPEYAEAMLGCLGDDPGWQGGVIDRPADRPVTHYERRALREGRRVTDLLFRLTPVSGPRSG